MAFGLGWFSLDYGGISQSGTLDGCESRSPASNVANCTSTDVSANSEHSSRLSPATACTLRSLMQLRESRHVTPTATSGSYRAARPCLGTSPQDQGSGRRRGHRWRRSCRLFCGRRRADKDRDPGSLGRAHRYHRHHRRCQRSLKDDGHRWRGNGNRRYRGQRQSPLPAWTVVKKALMSAGHRVANRTSVADVDKPGDCRRLRQGNGSCNPVIAIGAASAKLTVSGEATYGTDERRAVVSRHPRRRPGPHKSRPYPGGHRSRLDS